MFTFKINAMLILILKNAYFSIIIFLYLNVEKSK